MRLHTLLNGFKLILTYGRGGALIEVVAPGGMVVLRLPYDLDMEDKASRDFDILIEIYESPAPTPEPAAVAA